MIQRPAEAAGITFEVDPKTGIGLDGELLDAATQAPGALPLMEFTLDELYRRDIQTRGGDFLTFATFRALGGLEGAIAAQAEATVAALTPEVAAALPVLVRGLVLVGDDDRVGARAAPLTELQATPELAAITDALVAARLVVVSGATVRVAHEALLQSLAARPGADRGRPGPVARPRPRRAGDGALAGGEGRGGFSSAARPTRWPRRRSYWTRGATNWATTWFASSKRPPRPTRNAGRRNSPPNAPAPRPKPTRPASENSAPSSRPQPPIA